MGIRGYDVEFWHVWWDVRVVWLEGLLFCLSDLLRARWLRCFVPSQSPLKEWFPRTEQARIKLLWISI